MEYCHIQVRSEEAAVSEYINTYFYRKGVRHGLCRTFGLSFKARSDSLQSIAFYENGLIGAGAMWKGLIGGAYLVGNVDDDGEMFGDDCVFIYPDLRTAISGNFRGGQLVSGRTHEIVDFVIPGVGLPRPILAKRGYGPSVSRGVSTRKTMSSHPMQQDLWEKDRVEVRQSRISEEMAGEGLFALKPINAGQVVALFNGVRVLCPRNDQTEWSEYRIRLNGEWDLDVPADSRSTEQYRATLGHKANHSFNNNTKWSRIDHARFGLICAITANKDILTGEEILVNYGLEMSSAPAWYKSQWVQHCRRDKGMSDEDIVNWCGGQYAMKGKVIDLKEYMRQQG
jgi:hypothetical protein